MTVRPRCLASLALVLGACARAPAPPAAPAPAPSTAEGRAPSAEGCAAVRARVAAEPDVLVDRLPEPRAMTPPPLRRVPAAALRKDGSAEVKVDVVIDTLGRADMRTFKVVAASHPWFGTHLKALLPRWTFTPATLGGCLVPRVYHFSASQPARRARPAAGGRRPR